MEIIKIEAERRDVGKGAARAIRRNGNVPCVLYGRHVDPVVFQVTELSLKPLIFTNEARLVEVEVERDSWRCILKDIDFHPVTDQPLHADFQVLQEGEEITLTVPVRYEGTPRGQGEGGNTQYNVHELEVRCLPKDIPSHVSVDVSDLGIGDALHIGDLEIEGVQFLGAPERSLVTVVPPPMLAVEAEEEEELAVEGEVPLVGDEEELPEGAEGVEPAEEEEPEE